MDTGSTARTTALFLIAFLLLLGTVYNYTQINVVRTEMARINDGMSVELAKLREASSVTIQANRRNVSRLESDLETARRQSAMQAGQAKIEATKRAEELAKELAAAQRKQSELQAQIATEVSAVKEVANTATTRIGEVSTEVSTVKTDVANTRSELEKTVGNLNRVVGDQGVMSGLIATNGKELQALRTLGERNYVEFTLTKKQGSQKVGDVMLQLKKADLKRNRYTIELVADDRKVEKKDKHLNEPVQFYTLKAKQPYEIVVNDVKKDQIAGYLSVPKVQNARN